MAKGKSGEPKKAPAKSVAAVKSLTRSGNRGGPRTQLTELQKVLIANGGRNHSTLRRKKMETGRSRKRPGGMKKGD